MKQNSNLSNFSKESKLHSIKSSKQRESFSNLQKTQTKKESVFGKNKPQIPTKKPRKLTLLFLAFIFFILIVGGFFYWWSYIRVSPSHLECWDGFCIEVEGRGANQCSSDGNCKLEKEGAMDNFNQSTTEVLEINENNLNQLSFKLNQFLESLSEKEEKSFKKISIKVSDTSSDYYLGFNGFISALKIDFHDNIKRSIDDYNLFFYPNGGFNKLGLILQLEKKGNIKEDLLKWESEMINDLNPLFLNRDFSDIKVGGFNSTIYQNTSINYINFSDSDLAIDYALMEDKLLIANSKEMMFKLIDFVSNNSQQCKKDIENSFVNSLAFGDYEEICPSNLENLCKDKFYSRFKEGTESFFYAESLCNWVCEMISISKQDSNYFEKVILGWHHTEDYKGKDTKYEKINEKQLEMKVLPSMWRVAFVYRIDKDRVFKLCDTFEDSNKKTCLFNVEKIINQLSFLEDKCLN